VKPAAGEAGFTLIELIISLALFALIAMAGLSLVEALLNIQQRTSGRLDRLAELQRAMYVLDNDLTQASAGPITGECERTRVLSSSAAAGTVSGGRNRNAPPTKAAPATSTVPRTRVRRFMQVSFVG